MKQIITSLDIGTNSIKLIVGEIYREKLFVLAVSKVNSKGIKKGIVVNDEEVILSLKEAFKEVESVIGTKINRVILCVPSYFASFVKSEGYTTISRDDAVVTGEDITRSLQASVYNRVSPNLELVSVSPMYFIINEKEVVSDPKGMEACKVSANTMLAMAPKKSIYPLIAILENLGVKVVDLSFGGICDYYEFRTDKMKDKNVAVINIGHAKTEVSIIKEDTLINTEVLDIGGRNIDRDISYIYDLKLEDSKKIKETFAVAHKEKSSMNDICEVLTKSEENIKINQYEVSDIVHSRLREILELSKKQINLLTKEEISYIIVTGGITEIDGFNLVFKEVFGKDMVVSKVSELGVRNNSFSSALGFIKLYNAKLKFREKLASTVSEEEQELLFNEKKKIDDGSIIGKVYSYFFDN